MADQDMQVAPSLTGMPDGIVPEGIRKPVAGDFVYANGKIVKCSTTSVIESHGVNLQVNQLIVKPAPGYSFKFNIHNLEYSPAAEFGGRKLITAQFGVFDDHAERQLRTTLQADPNFVKFVEEKANAVEAV